MKEIKSVLERIIHQIPQDLEEAKEFLINYIAKTRIKDSDKRKMILTISKQKTYVGLLRYVYNCILKYEGYGVKPRR